MMKRFKTTDGKIVEVERETKTLLLKTIKNSDYYKGKNHDSFIFKDGSITYIYDATLNADMTEYDSKIAKDLSFEEDKYIMLSAYFVPTDFDDKFYIYNPRLLDILN